MAPGAGDGPSGISPPVGSMEESSPADEPVGSMDESSPDKSKKNRPTELKEIQKILKDGGGEKRMSFQSVVSSVAGAQGIRLPPEKGAEIEVVLADFELRIQKFVLSLLEPTIKRATAYEEKNAELRNLVETMKKQMGDVQVMVAKSEQQALVIENFREELSQWDVQRRTHEAKVAEEMSLTKHELEGFRYNLEQKESIIRGLTRTAERVNGEMSKVQEELTQQGVKYDEKHSTHYKVITKNKMELDSRLLLLEGKHNKLADDLWGEETGLATLNGEVQKTNHVVTEMVEEVKRLERKKASLQQVEAMQEEVNKLIREANSNVVALKATVCGVVKDVKEHFKTAASSISTNNANMISEMRVAYQNELDHAAKLRNEVMTFMQETQSNITHLEDVVRSSQDVAERLVGEVRRDVEDLQKKRKKDRASVDMEIKAHKKQMGGVYDSTDNVQKGLERLAGALEVLLESDRVQAALDAQDLVDRKNVALLGYKNGGDTSKKKSRRHDDEDGDEGGGKGGSAVISVDQRCLSCSGTHQEVLSGFKMACLNYTPGQVSYEKFQYDRSDLMNIRQELLSQAGEVLAANFGNKSTFSGGGLRVPAVAGATLSPGQGNPNMSINQSSGDTLPLLKPKAAANMR